MKIIYYNGSVLQCESIEFSLDGNAFAKFYQEDCNEWRYAVMRCKDIRKIVPDDEELGGAL